MMGSRQRLILCGWLTILLLPLLRNFSSLLKLTQEGNAEDHLDNDIDHPSFWDHASNNNNNDRVILECTFRDRKTKTTNITYVTPEEFYAEDSRCGHSFREDTAVFHVGKGGGGTIQKHLGIGVTWVHPRPRTSINEKFQNGPLRTLIFNVRDPVDRFVSAFNWRTAILCHPDDERHRGQIHLKGKGKVGATRRPNEYCKEGYEEEETMLRETYQSSPSVMAEALCSDSPILPNAEQDFTKVEHNTSLTEWLDFLIDPRLVKDIKDDGIEQFIVLPVEKRSGANETLFDQHIENLRHHLLSTRYGMDASNKMMRLAQEQKLKLEERRRRQMNDKPKHETHLHSSSKFFNSTKSTLTKLGECCLARFLSDDYRLIQSMLGGSDTSKIDFAIVGLDPLNGAHSVIQKACSWGDELQQQSCRGDLMSILRRRRKYLDESKGSCSAIINAE